MSMCKQIHKYSSDQAGEWSDDSRSVCISEEDSWSLVAWQIFSVLSLMHSSIFSILFR